MSSRPQIAYPQHQQHHSIAVTTSSSGSRHISQHDPRPAHLVPYERPTPEVYQRPQTARKKKKPGCCVCIVPKCRLCSVNVAMAAFLVGLVMAGVGAAVAAFQWHEDFVKSICMLMVVAGALMMVGGSALFIFDRIQLLRSKRAGDPTLYVCDLRPRSIALDERAAIEDVDVRIDRHMKALESTKNPPPTYDVVMKSTSKSVSVKATPNRNGSNGDASVIRVLEDSASFPKSQAPPAHQVRQTQKTIISQERHSVATSYQPAGPVLIERQRAPYAQIATTINQDKITAAAASSSGNTVPAVTQSRHQPQPQAQAIASSRKHRAAPPQSGQKPGGAANVPKTGSQAARPAAGSPPHGKVGNGLIPRKTVSSDV